MSAALAAAVGRALGRDLVLRPVTGGSICDAFRGGDDVFVKALHDAPAGLFAAEAAGLRWLAAAEALPVPEVLAVEAGWIALEWMESIADEEALGRGLATLHAAGAHAHGATPPGVPATVFLGPLALPAAPAPTWSEHYAGQRLEPLLRRAADRDALPGGARAAVERVIARIDALAGPEEPPARLHGDLWSGNVLGTTLIDPAAHGGHRETDLAMLRLFGGPSERCFAAYAEVAPLAEGHVERVGLWQLQPLLVHAILFGGSYGAAVERTATRVAPY